MSLDKNHPISLYYQLATVIQEQIETAKLTPGERLPSERELSEQFGISRMTVRQAINYLVRDGTLTVRPGVGTFVAEPKLLHDTLHLLSFTEDMMSRGATVTSQVLEQDVVTPPAYVSKELNLAAGEETVKIVRLRLGDGEALLLETSFIPATLCPGLEREELVTQSLYSVMMEKWNVFPESTHQTIEATIANDYEVDLFSIELDTAMILLEGVTYTEGRKPIEYFKALYRGDRFKFELQSRRQGPAVNKAASQRVSILISQPT